MTRKTPLSDRLNAGQRFRVGSLTGGLITPGAMNSGQRITTIWYVHDSGNCYRVMGEFRGAKGVDPEAEARSFAAELNAEDRAAA